MPQIQISSKTTSSNIRNSFLGEFLITFVLHADTLLSIREHSYDGTV
jgi:hypothetical protein